MSKHTDKELLRREETKAMKAITLNLRVETIKRIDQIKDAHKDLNLNRSSVIRAAINAMWERTVDDTGSD